MERNKDFIFIYSSIVRDYHSRNQYSQISAKTTKNERTNAKSFNFIDQGFDSTHQKVVIKKFKTLVETETGCKSCDQLSSKTNFDT